MIRDHIITTSVDHDGFLQGFPELVLVPTSDGLSELTAKLGAGRSVETSLMIVVSALTDFAHKGIEAATNREGLLLTLAMEFRHRGLEATAPGKGIAQNRPLPSGPLRQRSEMQTLLHEIEPAAVPLGTPRPREFSFGGKYRWTRAEAW